MRRSERVVVMVVMLAIPFLRLHGQFSEPQPDGRLTGAEVFDRVVQANALRAVELESYVSTRRYAVLEPGHEADAELKVAMQFVSPSTKIFRTVSANGVGWIHKRVFQGLMQAEQETVAGKEKLDSAITPANYDAQLLGTDQYDGRDAYVLALTPKRRDKYLFKGKAWIDAEDFAIAKIEGEPARALPSGSFARRSCASTSASTSSGSRSGTKPTARSGSRASTSFESSMATTRSLPGPRKGSAR